MKHPLLRALAAVALTFALSPAIAQDHSSHTGMVAKTVAPALTEGTIRRIDREAGSVTLTHGPIENLGMSAMTMTFGFKKGVVPAALKEGDKVRFSAGTKEGQYYIVRIEAAK